MEKTDEKMRKVAALVYLISNIYDRDSDNYNETEQQLWLSLLASTQDGLSNEQLKSKMNDVVWHASQVYKDRPVEDLSEDEQLLVTQLQEGGFLTKDPDHVSPTAGLAQ